MTVQSYDAGVLPACRAYLEYADLLAQLPPEVDLTEAQGARLDTWETRMQESRPNNLAELAAKVAVLEDCYEGSDAMPALKSIAADIRRLAGGLSETTKE